MSDEGKKDVAERLPTTGRDTGGPPGMQIGVPTEKSVRFWPSARRLLGRLRPDSFRVAGVLVFAVASVIFTVVGPMILGHATNIIFSGVMGSRVANGMTQQQAVEAARSAGHPNLADMMANMQFVPGQGIDFGALGETLLLAVLVYVAASLFAWAQGYVLNDVVQGAMLKLRAEVEDKVHRLPLSYFDKQPRGELLSRVTNDISNIQESLQQSMAQLITSALTVIGVVVMMFVISPLLAIIALVTIPVAMGATALIGKRSQRKFIAQWTHTGELNSQIEEAFTGHELVKVFGRQREVAHAFDGKNEELYEASFGAQFISSVIMPVMMFIGNLDYVFIAVVGGLRVATGSMTLGAVQAFIQYSKQFTRPLTQVASQANAMQSGVASAERVFDVLDAEEQSVDPVEAVRPAAVNGRVELERVSFSYVPDKPLIEDVSLVADPGHTIAIVGHTGAGKTTLVNLIMRFYELDAGRILLDGVDITTMRRDDLRSRVGMVLQDAWLFGGTIRDNILYGRPDASEDELLEASRAAFVDQFVRSLPDGYDTVVDEENSNISVGQKQLLTIARAFLTEPSLLILDEATSSVDTRTEIQVQHAMAALRTNRTSFVIAHRLSTIRDADLILVMEHGSIVEQGGHDELLAAKGVYHDLYHSQFNDAVAEEEPAVATADEP